MKQAELGQAQLKLGLGSTSNDLQWIARQLVLLYSLSIPSLIALKTNFPFYNILIQLEIAEFARASYS